MKDTDVTMTDATVIGILKFMVRRPTLRSSVAAVSIGINDGVEVGEGEIVEVAGAADVTVVVATGSIGVVDGSLGAIDVVAAIIVLLIAELVSMGDSVLLIAVLVSIGDIVLLIAVLVSMGAAVDEAMRTVELEDEERELLVEDAVTVEDTTGIVEERMLVEETVTDTPATVEVGTGPAVLVTTIGNVRLLTCMASEKISLPS